MKSNTLNLMKAIYITVVFCVGIWVGDTISEDVYVDRVYAGTEPVLQASDGMVSASYITERLIFSDYINQSEYGSKLCPGAKVLGKVMMWCPRCGTECSAIPLKDGELKTCTKCFLDMRVNGNTLTISGWR